MILYFLRHGEAARTSGIDADRALTLEGEEASKQIGSFCRKTGIAFTHALVSPYTRAQQTAEFVLKNYPHVSKETCEYLTPDSDPRNLFNELKHFLDSSSILLVSHEPFCSTAISQLISGGERSALVMKTTSLACVEAHLPIGKGLGILHWLITSDIVKKSLVE
ncbi:MAG: phosphohistidine phosphatase SixA [Bacteroidetes bacterium]|nr:phosphohistidine phosphatase SixA [Bacteroidota bacterium]